MAKRKFDLENIWIASDGDGGYYSYDSKEDADEYTERTGEDEAEPLERGVIEVPGYKMYILLKNLEVKHPDIFKTLKAEKVIKEVEKSHSLHEILNALGLKLPTKRKERKKKKEKRFDEDGNIQLSDGGIIERPDETGDIRRRDVNGNLEEIRSKGGIDYNEWASLFK